jgi:hypothetical protein
MRRLAFLALLGLSVLPGVALAQDASNPPPAGPGAGPGGQHWHHGGGWQHGGCQQDREAALLEKFYAANTTHDGHLTLAQAQAAQLKPIVDHFAQIDTKNHGYVTFYDIQAWRLDMMAKHIEQKADKLRAQD